MWVGNLGSEVNPSVLKLTFSKKYPSVAMARVVYDKRTGKSKGFGFVSFLDYRDCAQALRTMNGTFIGSQPVMLKTSKWKDRTNAYVVVFFVVVGTLTVLSLVF